MRTSDALKKLKDNSQLLNTLGWWAARTICIDILGEGKLVRLGYVPAFTDRPGKNSSEILVLRNMPGIIEHFGADDILASIGIDNSAPGPMPMITVFSRTKKNLPVKEYERFVEILKQVANQMRIPFYVEK